jgi:DNA-binding PadR family transcriptional regulator
VTDLPAVELSPGEWAVLGAIAEGPTHGFALARLLGPGGVLGRVWTLPRPVVYQALKKLTVLDLVRPSGTERGNRGPTRTIMALTPAGRKVLCRWLRTPVTHVRDARSELLLKLALIDRSGADATDLIEAQCRVLTHRRDQLLAEREAAAGFDRNLASWRAASVSAVLDFLTTYVASSDAPVSPPPA